MKKFLVTAVFCLTLVPTGAHSFYTIFPDGTLMTEMRIQRFAPLPFASCAQYLPDWIQSNTLAVNNLSTLNPVHIRVDGSCYGANGNVITAHMYDLYGTSPPTITVEFKDQVYILTWQVQSNVTGTWSPAGTFTLFIAFADIH